MRFLSPLRLMAVFFLMTIPLAGTGWAAPVAPDAAKAWVKALVDDATVAFSAKQMTAEQQTGEVLRLIEAYSSLETLSRAILGHHWDRAVPEDQESFKSLLGAYVVNTRVPKGENRKPGRSLEVGEAEAAGERAVVHSLLKTPDEPPTPIDWLVAAKEDGRPLVTDILSGGVSLVRTTRADFTAVINANGGSFKALLDAMRVKAEVAAAAK